jgi:hypothetical protein
MEFLSAIREVFDEDDDSGSGDDENGSIGSRDDRSRASRTRDFDKDDEDDNFNDERSEMSMFIGTTINNLGNKRKGGTDDLGSGGSDAEDSDEDASFADARHSNDEDDDSAARSHRSHRSKSTRKSSRSKRTTGSSRTGSSRSSKTKRKPADVLQEELRRQQGGKVLSVSSLKQDMADRRGTSVELLKKEFERQKREKEAARDGMTGAPNVSGVGAFSDGFGSNDAFVGANSGLVDTKSAFGSGGFDSNFADTAKGSEGADGLGAQLSRWEDNEAVTDLDDLMTVQQTTNTDSGGLSSFGFGPPSTIIQSISSGPSIPEMPLPTSLLDSAPDTSKPKKSGKKKKKNDIFKADFDDMPMPMTTITEFDEDDDNEMGLLASSSGMDDDEMSVRSSRSYSRGGRFKMSLKAPKLKGIGKLMPKRNKAENKMSSGFFGGSDDDDMGSGGLLG